jgi:hypothetical protein
VVHFRDVTEAQIANQKLVEVGALSPVDQLSSDWYWELDEQFRVAHGDRPA